MRGAFTRRTIASIRSTPLNDKRSVHLKSSTVREWMMFIVLVAIGAAGRWLFRDIPNFTPAAGVAVFAGLYFSTPALALLTPLAVMVVSNIGLQSYGNWGMLAVVYAALLFPVFLSRVLSQSESGRRRLRPTGMLACGVLPSMFFFLLTNFAVWFGGGLYAPTPTGLLNCYIQAIPFYHYTLISDLLFIGIAILSYELIVYFDRSNQTMAVEN